MIKHYLILKLKEAYRNGKLIEEIINEFTEMEHKIEFIYDMEFVTNCNTRDSNSDLMIIFSVDSLEDINKYVKHELHLNFIKEYGDKISTKATIDEQIK